MKPGSKRTCIGCQGKQPKEKLARLVLKNGQVVVELGTTQGRGAYLCQDGEKVSENCFNLAKEKNAFEKAFKTKINQGFRFKKEAASGGCFGSH